MVNPRTGRVHTHYAQAVAVTGRLSSNDPNLQNIPIRTPEGRRVREAFIAPPGSVIAVGRLLADRAAHHGPHQRRRRRCCAPSPRASTCTARPRPRCSAWRSTEVIERAAPLCQGDQLRPDLRHERVRPGAATSASSAAAAAAYIERYFARYPGVKRYMDETARWRQGEGLCRDACSAAASTCPRSTRPTARAAAAPSAQAINAPMQGTAADLIKLA